MAFSLKVHEYGKVPGSPFQKIIKSRHHMRLTRRDHAPLYIQEGRVYSEGGEEITSLPDWFNEDLNKIDQRQLKAVGWNGELKYKEKKRGRKPKPVEPENINGNDSPDGKMDS